MVSQGHIQFGLQSTGQDLKCRIFHIQVRISDFSQKTKNRNRATLGRHPAWKEPELNPEYHIHSYSSLLGPRHRGPGSAVTHHCTCPGFCWHPASFTPVRYLMFLTGCEGIWARNPWLSPWLSPLHLSGTEHLWLAHSTPAGPWANENQASKVLTSEYSLEFVSSSKLVSQRIWNILTKY